MVALLVLVGGLLGTSSPSISPSTSAVHGALRRSAPARAAKLQRVPRELRLTFTEPVERAVARLWLSNPRGEPVPLGVLEVPPDSAAQIVAPIQGGMTAGRYTVRWQVAGADGHPVRGEFSFDVSPGAVGAVPEGTAAAPETAVPSTVVPDTAAQGTAAPHAGAHGATDTVLAGAVGAPPATTARHHDPASFPASPGAFDVGAPAYVAIRWFSYLAVLGVIGAGAFRFAVLGRVASAGDGAGDALIPGAAESSATVGAISSGLLLLAAALRLVAQTTAMHGSGAVFELGAMRPMITGTTWGWGWILLVGAGIVGLLGCLRARRHEPWGWLLAVVAGGMAAFALALSGHAVAVPGWRALAVTADALHVVGAGGWLGSLGVLLLAGLTAARKLDAGVRDAAIGALVRAFSPTALVAAAVVSATGLVAAWLHIGTPAAVWSSQYGRLLLLKLAVVALVAATGAYNWRRVLPVLGQSAATVRVQRSARAEVLIAVLVLGITAVLVATSPPMPSAPAAEQVGSP